MILLISRMLLIFMHVTTHIQFNNVLNEKAINTVVNSLVMLTVSKTIYIYISIINIYILLGYQYEYM